MTVLVKVVWSCVRPVMQDAPVQLPDFTAEGCLSTATLDELEQASSFAAASRADDGAEAIRSGDDQDSAGAVLNTCNLNHT